MLGDSVAESCRAILDEEQVEATQHRTVLGDEDVVRGDAGFLLGQQSVVSLGEVFVERIASVGDRCGKVSAVRQLVVQHRRGVVSALALLLGLLLTLCAGRAHDVRTSALTRSADRQTRIPFCSK